MLEVEVLRTCGTCSACCEGWLSGNAYGYGFWPGRKCHFLATNGCSIYENRPENPCKMFKCLWLSGDIDLPEWMKPSECNVIFSYQMVNGIQYILISEAGKDLNAEVLSWVFMEYLKGNIGNFAYRLKGGNHYVGDKSFLEACGVNTN